MFCPVCRSEFRADILFCQGCEQDLVPALDSENLFESFQKMEEALAQRELVPVLLGTQSELRRIQEALYRERLPSLLANAGEEGFQPGVPQRLYLMAPEEHVGEVMGHLENVQKESLLKEGVVEEVALGQISSCPACGSDAPANAEECPECGLVLGVSEDVSEN